MRVTISSNLMSNFKLQEEMKKLSLIFGLALGMLAVGCSNDPIVENNTPELGDTVTLGVSLDEQTRTSLGGFVGDKCQVLWSAGDKIAVNGIASDAVAEQYVGTTTANFTVTNVTAPYSIIYPAEAIDNNGQLNLPTFQAYASGSFASGTAVMAGYATDNNIAMKHLLSVIKLTIAQGSETTSAFNAISITALDSSTISGVFSVDYQGAKIAPVAGKDIVTITNVPIVDGKAVVYVAVPAGDYTKGLGVKVVGSDFSVMSRTAYASTGIVLGSGYLVNMPELTFAGKATEDIVITTAEQLQTLRETTLAVDNTFKGKIKLGCDIDMTGVITDGVQAYLYDGATFDGQGYSIKNWTATQGLIYENYGVMKNIVLDSSCQFSYDLTSAHKMCGFIAMCNLGTVSGCVNNADVISNDSSVDFTGNRFLGTIVGCSSAGVNPSNADPYDPDKCPTDNVYPDARVENCINNGKITVAANSYNSGWLHIGGIAGIYWQHINAGAGGFFNCINNGDVQVDINTNGKVSAVAGIVGAAGKIYPNPGSNKICYLTIENCINNGDISYRCDTKNDQFYLGGITGYQSGKSQSLTNNGAITFSAASASTGNKFIGGVAGLFTNEVDDCHNTGNVTVENYVYTNNLFYVGGLFACWSGYDDTTRSYVVSNSTNSGAVSVMYTTEKNINTAFGGLVGYIGNKSTINSQQYVGKLTFTDCKNSGEIYVDRQGAAQARAQVGGVLGYIEKGNTLVRCINEGNITVNFTGIATDTAVAGIAGTLYVGMEDCQQLGDITFNSATPDCGAIVGGFGSRQGNSKVSWNGCVLDTEITFTENMGVIAGLLQGDYWGQTNILSVGETTPCVVKSTSKFNGTAVTAEMLADHSVLVGRDQKVDTLDDKKFIISIGDRTTSAFKIAEGGLILE